MSSRPSSFVLTQPGPLRLFSTVELLALPPPTWLVDGIIPEGGLCGLYGPPESTKSFLAIDLALCVATGLPWHGHAVQRGFVIYVAAEGGPGVGKRVRAWLLSKGLGPTEANITWLIESLSIYKESDDLDILMKRIDEEIEQQPRLMVVDTLARCLEGNENEQEDMGGFIAGLDRLRHEYRATLLAIHHTRLDGDRERGNTAFRGGTDTMISITRENQGEVTLACTKQKDAEHFHDMHFRLEPIREADSCIVKCVDEELVPKLQQILEILHTVEPCTWEAWFSSTGLPKTTFHRSFMELRKTGQIIKENGQWRVKRADEFHDKKWHK